ncbi:prephenate dehydratase [Candidatus Saccharibacteria bacterium]|nr:prephenate dehydratase [Candidatus Saccharibacteria bacterium]
MHVAIQGQTGSFHDKARQKLFKYSDGLHCSSFSEVFEAVKSARAEYGIVAIENSIYGSINEVYGLLLDKKLWVAGEIYLHVSFSLLANKEAELSSISEVYSHPIALAECKYFLDDKLPQAERINSDDTARAAEEVAEAGENYQAAIASDDIAEKLNLKVLASEIENDQNNYTRFIIIQKSKQQPDSANKTSVALELPEKPGALHKALGYFAERNINLTKIESRPVPGKAWHYLFYVDFEASLTESREVIKDLQDNDSKVTILGSYVKAHPLGDD